jgi:N-acetyl sugar amidotransferase
VNVPEITYCTNCAFPSSSAVPLAFNDEGVCSGCETANQRVDIDWDRKLKIFKRILNDYKSENGSKYDCMIPVSGGKDSYFQIHVIKEMGLNPLLVTYNGYNFSETGMKNLRNMREAFDCDHIWFTPSVKVLKTMNRLGMLMMGDMNWHNHAGIVTYPIIQAVNHKLPLMIWGEHGFMDLGGMHSYSDMIEFTYRSRHEHDLRGYEWTDFIEAAKEFGEELEPKHCIPFMYPSDEEIDEVEVRGLFLSNYVKWEPNSHAELMKTKYGFLEAEVPFERTYRRTSNLDDMHENGIHDYMKFVKFGYGRATDHVSKDIRDGLLTRKEGIERIKKMDHIKSSDLDRWLKYVGWTEEKFDAVADTFRDSRVWAIKDGLWWKNNIWGETSSYGKVHLSEKDQEKYTKL